MCDLCSLYPPVRFLRMCLGGTIAITNNDGDSASPLNIPLWIFTSAKLCLPVVNSIPVFHGFSDELHGFVEYFIHFESVYYSALWDDIVFLFGINLYHWNIFPFHFALLDEILINESRSVFFCSLTASFLFFGKQSAAY